MVNWFSENAWLASWLALGFVVSAEATILYLLWRYLKGLLGSIRPQDLTILAWKLSQFSSLTAAERERYMEYLEEQKNGTHP